jgi:hypothetical protein
LDVHSATDGGRNDHLLTTNFSYLIFQALRGGRNLQGSEWACIEIDVDNDFAEFGGFCPIFQDFVDNPDPDTPPQFFNLFPKILRTCCKNPSSDVAAECCRCNRQQVDDPDTRFFFFRSLNAQGECPGIFEGGNNAELEPTFVSATDVAPGQVMKALFDAP